MRAALVTGLRTVELRDFPDPIATDGSAVVQIALCGICGTDVHAFQSGQPYTPAVCGHEWTGTVRAVGTGVTHVAEGDRVVIAVGAACGRCAACLAGHGSWCSTVLTAMTGRDPKAPPHGGFAPAIAVDASRVLRVVGDLTDEQAAMVEPATIALHATRRTPIPLGALVVVQGCGPIGQLVLQCARAAGAGTIVAVEPDGERRALAARLGATHAVTPAEAGPLVQELSRGLGADLVFECAGVAATVQSAVDLCRRGGLVNLVGLAAGAATIVPAVWLIKEVSVVCSLGYQHDEFRQCMELIGAGRLELAPLHNATVSLDQFAETLAQLADAPAGLVKVLVDPHR